MSTRHSQLEFPVIAFSKAGWWKEAADLSDLRDASPDDSLEEWHDLEIYDSTGRRFTAIRAFGDWPRTRVGLWLCRLLNTSVHVGFHLSPPQNISVEELNQRVNAVGEPVPDGSSASTHKQLLEHLCL